MDESKHRFCGGCAFFAMHLNNVNTGDCRFNPPSLVSVPDPKGMSMRSFWPRTERSNKACAKHRTAEENELDKKTLPLQ